MQENTGNSFPETSLLGAFLGFMSICMLFFIDEFGVCWLLLITSKQKHKATRVGYLSFNLYLVAGGVTHIGCLSSMLRALGFFPSPAYAGHEVAYTVSIIAGYMLSL